MTAEEAQLWEESPDTAPVERKTCRCLPCTGSLSAWGQAGEQQKCVNDSAKWARQMGIA